MPDGALLHQLAALVQVVLIDLTLAGDNAVVVGLAVSGSAQRASSGLRSWAALPRPRLIRIALGAVTLQLLEIVGLLLAGGLLLLWVCWRMYRELRQSRLAAAGNAEPPKIKTLRQAMVQIVLADLSMSLDNVLAVAGAAGGHYLGAGDGPGIVGGADGRGREPGRAPAGAVPLGSSPGPGC